MCVAGGKMHKIIIPAKLGSLKKAYDFIFNNIPESYNSIRLKIELVMEELLVNIFKYAYLDENGNKIEDCEIEICKEIVNYELEECLKITIRDWGIKFDPFSEAPIPNLSLDVNSRPIGGLGVHFIKNITRNYQYTYLDKSNIVDLYFSVVNNK